jgi:electron transfer flavoprotein beta subunit
MEIIVCVKRVPELTDLEVAIDASGKSLKNDDLVFALNEWDRFAVEEALRLKEEHSGSVTVITIGDEESEDVLRRSLAMGADDAVRLWDPSFSAADGYLAARILHAAISKRPFDLILVGSVSSDTGAGVVGGMLAAMLDVPQTALATAIDVIDGTASVQHEVEGGLERLVELDLPAVVSVQTGINEPRYVSIRGIRKVSGVEIPVLDGAALELEPEAISDSARRVTLEELFVPPVGDGAEILEGPTEDVVAELVQRLKAAGGV